MSIYNNVHSDLPTAIGVHNRPTKTGPSFFLLWHTKYLPGFPPDGDYVRGQIFAPDIRNKSEYDKRVWDDTFKDPNIRWIEDHRILDGKGFASKSFISQCEKLILARKAHLLPHMTRDYHEIDRLLAS